MTPTAGACSSWSLPGLAAAVPATSGRPSGSVVERHCDRLHHSPEGSSGGLCGPPLLQSRESEDPVSAFSTVCLNIKVS